MADELTMLKVHCEAVLRLTSAAAEAMRERGRGGVVNVASVAAFVPRGTYGASKAWVVQFTQGAAKDLAGSGVRLMALCPGFVRTEFHERAGMGTDNIPGWMWLDADKVVAAALDDLARGRTVSIPDPRYKALMGVAKLGPAGAAGRDQLADGAEVRAAVTEAGPAPRRRAACHGQHFAPPGEPGGPESAALEGVCAQWEWPWPWPWPGRRPLPLPSSRRPGSRS